MKIAIAYALILVGITTASGFMGYELGSIPEDTTVCYWFNAGSEMEPNWVMVSDYTEDGLCHYGMD